MARVHNLTHGNLPIVHLDLSNLKPGEFQAVFEEASRALTPLPLKTARVVTDVSGARFDPATISLFEKFIRTVTPHCACNAVVGVTGIQKVAWLGLRTFYKCPAELADSLQAGKDWVVKQ